MPEFLVAYRHNDTNALVNITILGVSDEDMAITMANNSLLDSSDHHFDHTFQYCD